MCCLCPKLKEQVSSVYNCDGELIPEVQSHTENLPEHVDNIYLDRNVPRGVLGFRYKNKDEVYHSLFVSGNRNLLYDNAIETYERLRLICYYLIPLRSLQFVLCKLS